MTLVSATRVQLSKKIFQVHGHYPCLAQPKASADTWHIKKRQTYQELKDDWDLKMSLFLAEHGNKVREIIVVYECEWKKRCAEGDAVKHFLASSYKPHSGPREQSMGILG